MNSKRILLVEDEATTAMHEREVVESLGYEVTAVVDTGEAALHSVEVEPPDLVLMDIMLKDGIDGINVAEKIRSQYDLPIVYVTAYASEQFIERAKLTEPFGYVVKPFDRQSLVSNIEIALYKHLVDKRRRESEEKYQDLYNNAPDMYFTVRQDGIVSSVNRSGAESLGYSVDELINGPVWKVVHPAELTRVKRQMTAIFQNRQRESTLEFRKIRKDGSVLWVQERIRVPPQHDDSLPMAYINCRDITKRKHMEVELEYLATHDTLTGLFSRDMLLQQTNDELARAQRYDHALSIFSLDIDHFKHINDTYGHSAGDAVLRGFAGILKSSIRKTDCAARVGGDEFVIILPETPLAKAEELAERICNQIAEHPFAIEEDEKLRITASIGIATFPEHAHSSEELLKIVDSAMYAAKDAGRNQVKRP